MHVSATSQFHEEALKNDLKPLSAAQTHWHSGDYPCELINVKVFFKSRELLTQLHHFYSRAAYCAMIEP